VGRRGGEVVKTTGDGVLALLPTATAAIGAARSIRERLREDDLDVRIGIHVGEFDRRGDDVSGLAVNVASRVMSEAATGQILVSDLVPRLAAASTFEDVGDRTLKGVEGTWRLFEAV
jgi:class 3 adenylate cyclase